MKPRQSIDLSGVSETLLLTLYVRMKESKRADGMLKDEQAAALVGKINYDFRRIRIQRHDEVTILLRMREFDRLTREFLERNSEAAVVHVGCGLDTRFDRVDDGCVEWFDLDLPEVTALRSGLIRNQSQRYHLISGSILDEAWRAMVEPHRGRRFLFVAEGVLPYFEENQVRSLLLNLKEYFPGCEVVFDGMSPFTIWADNLHLAFSRIGARLQWGLKNGKDIQDWGAGIHMLEEWYYFDRFEPRLRSFQWIRHVPFLAKSAGIFHFRLGSLPQE